MAVPKYVEIVRGIIPKDGVKTDKPSRLKSKIKKALDRANIQSETIRGVGRKVGDHALVYKEENGILYATFAEYTKSLVPSSSGRKRKTKVQPILTGKHPDVANLTLDEYVKEVVQHFPEEWGQSEASACRWISTDMHLLFNTGYTIESAANYIQGIVQQHLASQPRIHFTVISVPDMVIIGVGPA